jgi:hypothetical protein
LRQLRESHWAASSQSASSGDEIGGVETSVTAPTIASGRGQVVPQLSEATQRSVRGNVESQVNSKTTGGRQSGRQPALLSRIVQGGAICVK